MLKSFISFFAVILLSHTAQAIWTTIDLPDRLSYESTAMSHLSDGRLLYAHDGNIYRQSAFGSSSTVAFSNAPSGAYSFVTGNGFIGVGSFGGSAPIYSFNAGDSNAPFTNSGSIQSYTGATYENDSILTVGINGDREGSSVSEVGIYSRSGMYTTIVSNVSTYSGGIAWSGDTLYVADNDDTRIYSFSSSQVSSAINGAELSIENGTFITNLGVSGSIAVDSEGRIFASGYQSNGIQVYDPSAQTTGSLFSNDAGTSYTVGTFSNGSNNYIAWLNAEGYSAGDGITYGYALEANVPVPEPANYGLFMCIIAIAFVLCRRLGDYKKNL
tara:strand:+ start:2013 stop:2996 length:984 start_codon:yes stop_codon:yes gene_type:complete